MYIRPSTFTSLQVEPSPEGGVLPPDPPGITRFANGILPWSEGDQATDYFGRVIRPKTEQGGEMIYWERLDGGRAETGKLPFATDEQLSIQCYNGPADGEYWIRFDDFRIHRLSE